MAETERPSVDVWVVTWNTGELTARALREVLDTDQGCEVRVLVRDNASRDDTVGAIRRLVPEADVDAGQENLGFAAGVNTLIARSSAPWIFLLNPDAWPLPGAIGNLVRATKRRPRAAAVAPRLEYPDGRVQHSTHPFPSLRVAATVAFAWSRIPPQRAEELLLEGAWGHDRPRRVDWAHGAAWLIRRSALEDIGGFDEGFFMYAEDLEWCWRAQRKGWEIWFEPSAIVRHHSNVSGEQGFGDLRTRAHVHSALRFYRREHGLLPAVAWWTVNVAGSSVRWLDALRLGRRERARYWRTHTAANLLAPFTRQVRVRR